MLYNKQVFADNNLDVPTTWDEFIDVCDTLKNKEITPIAFGNSDKWYTMWYVGQFNANFVNKDVRTADYNPSSGAFTDEGYVKAVQTFLDLNDAGYLGKNVNSKDYYQVREEFAAGKQAMILDATSQFSFYTGAMGEDGYGYFKIPIPDGATGDEASTIVTGGSENYAISAETKHPDEAVKFLKFLTKKAQAEKQTKETGLPNAIIGGITEDNSDAVIAAAYKTSEDYNAIAEWLDQCVDGNVSNTYMASLQEALDGKLAEDVMADVQKAAKELQQEFGREAEPGEIAKKLGDRTEEEVKNILSYIRNPVSLETPVGEDGEDSLGDFVEDRSETTPEDAMDVLVRKEEVQELLETLNDREKEVISLRFGLGKDRTYTLEEIGESLGITRERVRQIESKAMEKLRKKAL